MAEYEAGQVEANGVVVPITVDDNGSWIAKYDGRTLAYPVREKLEAAIKRLTKRASITVAVSVVKVDKRWDGASAVRATATGIHGANGNVLVTLHHGGRRGDDKEQISARYGSQAGLWFGGDVTDSQIAEFDRLVQASAEAQKAVRALEERLKIDLFKTMEHVLAEHTPGED